VQAGRDRRSRHLGTIAGSQEEVLAQIEENARPCRCKLPPDLGEGIIPGGGFDGCWADGYLFEESCQVECDLESGWVPVDPTASGRYVCDDGELSAAPLVCRHGHGWIADEWSSCQAPCELCSGVAHREVRCRDEVTLSTVPDYLCDAFAPEDRPAEFAGCEPVDICCSDYGICTTHDPNVYPWWEWHCCGAELLPADHVCCHRGIEAGNKRGCAYDSDDAGCCESLCPLDGISRPCD
jgi:hypothetical protein